MLIGHKKQWDYLSRLALADSLSHGYVFCGQEKIGKKTLAIHLAKQIYGNDPLSRINGNFKIIIPDGKEIKIGQVRELMSWLSLKSPNSQIKMAIIDDAHLLNDEAQNCLLKTLEEPKGKTVIILVTASEKSLLKTVISRLSLVKFYPQSKDIIKDSLIKEGVKEKEAEQISCLAMGKPGIAKDLINYPSQLEKQEQAISLLNEILKSPLSRRIAIGKGLGEDHKNIREMLTVWVWELRKKFLLGNQSTTKLRIKKTIERLEYTKALIDRTNVNPILAMETLMMEM